MKRRKIANWFSIPGVPFKNITDLARAIVKTSGHHYLNKKVQSVSSYLAQIWRGERPCSADLKYAIKTAIKENSDMTETEVEKIISAMEEDWGNCQYRGKFREIIPLLVDLRYTGAFQAVLETTYDEKVVEEFFETIENVPGLSKNACLEILLKIYDKQEAAG